MSYAGFTDRSGPGGVVHNPASAYSREMAKWEMGYSPYGPPGRPRELVGHQEYPAMFYKVRRSAAPHEVSAGPFVVEHHIEAKDENEARNLESRGYVRGRAAAEQAIEASEQALAVAAAERAFSEQRMSDNAKAEAAKADDATSQHLGEIPVTPIKRRGRPRKVTTEAAPAMAQES